MFKYQKGYIYEGHTFVVDKADIRNAKDNQFVEGTALLPIQTPCDLCRHNPPSAMGGKPCVVCPADTKEETNA